MSRNIRYPGLHIDNSLESMRLGGSSYSTEMMIEQAAEIMKAHGRVVFQRGEEIYNTGGVKKCNCVYSRIRASDFNDDYLSDVRFEGVVTGSMGDNYYYEIHLIREDSSMLFKCSCPYYSKEQQYHRNICKHLCAAITWIKNNYVFDENNYVSDYRTEPYGNKNIKLADGSVEALFFYSFDELEIRIGRDAIAKLRLYEKANRYLEKGLTSKDDNRTGWSDIYNREQFKILNKDFDSFMHHYLFDTSPFISRGRRGLDRDFVEFNMRDYASPSLSSTFEKRVENIEHSIAENPFQIGSMGELQRLIDTYTRITKFKVGTYVFEGKYIYVPNYFELLVIEAKDMPLDFYNRFKLGGRTFKDGFVYEANNRQYFVLVNYLGAYNNTVGENNDG